MFINEFKGDFPKTIIEKKSSRSDNDEEMACVLSLGGPPFNESFTIL